MPSSFCVLDAGTIFRNESGLQGYYPRVVRLSDNEFLASFVAGTSLETPDSHPELARSTDGGVTWKVEGAVDSQLLARRDTTETGFISRDRDGSLFCLGARWAIDPNNPDLPLVYPETIGMRENQTVLRRSFDNGRSWTPAEIVPKPFPVPLEIPTGIVALDDGTKILSCSTWKRPDGTCPYGHRVIVTKSSDDCRSWSKPVDVFYDSSGRVGYWEGRVAQISGGALLATCWAHDWASEADIPNHYSLSYDLGESWTKPTPMPVTGQTGWPVWLGDDRILFVYNHRKHPVGVRGLIARISDASCEALFDAAIFEPQLKTESTISSSEYAVTDFQFGAPSAISLGMNKYLTVYWCVVQGRAGIDWAIIEVSK